MIHPSSRLVGISDMIGRGVIATEAIPMGTFLWVRDAADQVLSPSAMLDLEPSVREMAMHFGYRDHRGRVVVCADAGRYVNHSCEPTMRGVGADAMIAVRDVAPGDELTCDYAECNLIEPLDCVCGTSSCRGRIFGDDLETLAKKWQPQVERALAKAASVAQPLLPLAVDCVRLRASIAGLLPCPDLSEVLYRSGPRLPTAS